MKKLILIAGSFGALCALVLAVLITLILLAFLALIYFNKPTPQEDITGQTPRELLDVFLSDCRTGNMAAAKSRWTPESLKRFPDHIQWFAELGKAELSYGEASNGKYETIWVIVAEGTLEGKSIWRHFYFEVRDSKWYLHWHKI